MFLKRQASCFFWCFRLKCPCYFISSTTSHAILTEPKFLSNADLTKRKFNKTLILLWSCKRALTFNLFKIKKGRALLVFHEKAAKGELTSLCHTTCHFCLNPTYIVFWVSVRITEQRDSLSPQISVFGMFFFPPTDVLISPVYFIYAVLNNCLWTLCRLAFLICGRICKRRCKWEFHQGFKQDP